MMPEVGNIERELNFGRAVKGEAGGTSSKRKEDCVDLAVGAKPEVGGVHIEEALNWSVVDS